jgi:hypothetical protein
MITDDTKGLLMVAEEALGTAYKLIRVATSDLRDNIPIADKLRAIRNEVDKASEELENLLIELDKESK